jgi:hypothetical protein
MRESYDALVDVFECIENFLSRLRVYTVIHPTMALTETIIDIMVELLAVLSLATKQINQGRLSKYRSTLLVPTRDLDLTRRREICKEAAGRARHCIDSSATGSTHTRGVQGDRCPDSRCRPWSGKQHAGRHAR